MRFPVLILLAIALMCGCESPMFNGTVIPNRKQQRQQEQSNFESARLAAQVQQNDISNRQLSEQLEAINRSLGLLEQRVERLETAAAQRPADAGVTKDELVALRRDIQMVRGDQEKMRMDITNDLAGRIEKIAARQSAPAASPAARPAAAAPAQPAGTAKAAPRGSGYEHKVEKGQTLTEIAREYGTTVKAIMKANNLSNASSIRIGQVLFIPDP
ncbi:MAG: LysM peptidoglycan-binding domain-containing protein [Kiritimatiellae bacterium]|nr:LysM peptidoglycan-binding domain-containing protein [Kiritimatiellia bacterium]